MKLQDQLINARAVAQARWSFRRATQLGDRVRVWGRPAVTNWGEMNIGSRVRIFSTVATTELRVNPQATLDIGAETFINSGCSISASKLVRIGPRCNIGSHAILIDNDFHHIEPERRTEIPESRPIVLEENVWLGDRVIVLNGVTIGADSVVGAGSVVTTDIPAGTIAAGMPAEVIRSIG